MASCCCKTQTGCPLPEPRFANLLQEPRGQRSAWCGGAGSTGPPIQGLRAQAWLCFSVWGENRPTGSTCHSNCGAHLGYGIFRDLGNKVRDPSQVGEGKGLPLNIKENLQNGNK